MDQNLSNAEQALSNEFDEKLDVTETPVTPASDSASFEPEVAPAPAPAVPAEPALPPADATPAA